MPKLCEVIAVVSGKKSHAESKKTQAYHMLQKPALFEGISRIYRPRDDEGEQFPPESKRVQGRVKQVIDEVTETLTDFFDLVATQDKANCSARADVSVDGKAILSDVPVTHLLFLEKQLVDLRTFIGKLPTLDPAYDWEFDAHADCYATPATETTKTKKVPKNHVLAEATKEHPAQVQVYTEDVLVGYWKKIDFSGAIPEKEKNEYLARLEALIDAVKCARERANSMQVDWEHQASNIFAYVFVG